MDIHQQIKIIHQQNIKPAGSFSGIVKHFNLCGKRITFKYKGITHIGKIGYGFKGGNCDLEEKDFYIGDGGGRWWSASSLCLSVKKQIWNLNLNGEQQKKPNPPTSAQGTKLVYVDNICFNTYRSLFAYQNMLKIDESISEKSSEKQNKFEQDKLQSLNIIVIQKIVRGWIIRKNNTNLTPNENWFNKNIKYPGTKLLPNKYDWDTSICDIFKISLGIHMHFHFRMEKNYQNILLYYLKQSPNYNFIEEVVTPLQFIGNCGQRIQMSGNQSSRYDLWDPVKFILMELKFCPSGLKDKEREQIKIYMEQRREHQEHWARTIGFLVNFAKNFEFELYFYKGNELQLMTITNMVRNKQCLSRPYISINKIC